MQLYIANKNYSSWSMRPWVLMRHFDLPFEEVMLRFGKDSPSDPKSPFKNAILRISPAGRVPVLVDGDLVVWDSLAIAETLAERVPQHPLWPREARSRARARSMCAEMHSGLGALRRELPMNIELHMPEIGPRRLAESPELRADVTRVVAMWSGALDASGGPFLFGTFGIADAYFAPVASRFRSYGVSLPAPVQAYADRVRQTAAFAAWVEDALVEHEFVADDEPYRTAPAR
ncbi:MAG: glutathione S-transferase family protein [Planctomycetota bacterium]